METQSQNRIVRRKFLQVLIGGALAGAVRLPVLHAKDGEPAPAKPPREKVAEMLGEQMTRILGGAKKVEAFRISPRQSKNPQGKHVDGYPVLAAAKEQGEPFARRLAALVQEDRSLLSEQARCFSPGVAFRLWKEKESVDVVVCYQCWNLRLTARDAAGKVLHQSSGGFKANFDAWVKLAQEAFPDDKEIQGLGEGDRL